MLYTNCFVNGAGERLSLDAIRQAWRNQHDDDTRERAIATWYELQSTHEARVCEDHYMMKTRDDIFDAIVLYLRDVLPVRAHT